MKNYLVVLAIAVLAMTFVLPVYAGSTVPPIADFDIGFTTVTAGQPVTFTDLSTGSPTSWRWRFISDSPTPRDFPPPYDYYEQNPVVTFDNNWIGLHATVVLTVTNEAGTDTKTQENVFIVTSPLPEPPAEKQVGVFRPETGNWYFDYNLDGVVDKTLHFGSRGDIPFTGDWNNDGVDGIAVFRPSTGNWYFDNNLDGIADIKFHFGKIGDIPVMGKFT